MEPFLTDAKHALDTLQCTTEITNPKLISRKLYTDLELVGPFVGLLNGRTVPYQVWPLTTSFYSVTFLQSRIIEEVYVFEIHGCLTRFRAPPLPL